MKKWQAFQKTLFLPVDSSSLGLFRILLGLLLFYQAYFVYNPQFVLEHYIKPVYHFPFSLFEALHLPRLSATGMFTLFNIMGLSTILIATGLGFGAGCTVFLLTFLYAFLFDKCLYNEHYYIILLTVSLFLISHPPAWPSLNSLRLKKIQTPVIPYWQILILRFQVICVYFFAGLSKLNADWLVWAEPMYSRVLLNKTLLGFNLHNLGLAYFLSYGGVIIDLTLPFFLIFKSTRKIACVLIILFNLTNHFFYNDIGIFPFLMIAFIAVFLEPNAPRKFMQKLARSKEEGREAVQFSPSKPIIIFLAIYALAQILIPLRHYLYPGHAIWTFEGARFAYRVKINAKDVKMKITLVDPKTGKSYTVNHQAQLTSYQQWLDNMPDTLLQYTHYLKNDFLKEGIQNPQIFVEATASLNGRPFQPFIRKDVNLAEVNYPLSSHAWWIVPLDKNSKIPR